MSEEFEDAFTTWIGDFERQIEVLRKHYEVLRLAAWLIFFATFLAMAFVYHPETGWNVNTRLNLVFAVVDRGTVDINDYHAMPPYETGDKAIFEGNYYSDKIFGVSLLALPPYFLAQKISGDRFQFHAAHWLMKTFAVAIPGGISAALFFLILALTGTPPRRAALITVFSVFGTMWYGYGTVFYPYIPGLACLLGALYITLFPCAKRLTVANCFAVGFLLGYALLCDLIFGLAVFPIGVIWLLRALDQVGVIGWRAFAEMSGDRSRLKHLIVWSVVFWVGVLIPLLIFAVYTYSVFGEFSVPYKYEADELFREGMSRGFMGVTSPKPAVLYFITVHPYRGIFVWSPIVLLGLIGCILATRHYGKRPLLGCLGIFTFVAYILFNSGYYMWWGGWCMGPRFLVPMLPFVLFGLGELARFGKLSSFENHPGLAKPAWYSAIVLGVLSIALSLPLSLFDPQIRMTNPTAVLQNVQIGDGLNVPQKEVLTGFYRGYIGVQPTIRFAGFIGSESRTSNYLSWILFLLVLGGVYTIAWWKSPVKIAGYQRSDFPFKTIDGTAAPPPPGMT